MVKMYLSDKLFDREAEETVNAIGIFVCKSRPCSPFFLYFSREITFEAF